MDAFTENILARARERQKMLEGLSGQDKKAPLREANMGSFSEPNLTDVKRLQPKEVRSETCIPNRMSPSKENISEGSPDGLQTKTLNILRDDFNMEIKVKSAENVRLQVEIEEHEEDGNGDEGCDSYKNDKKKQAKEESVGLREESKNRLKRLGKLYSGKEEVDISSPIHRTEAKFYQSLNETDMENSEIKKDTRPKKGLSKLADLAETITHWEDDLSHPKLPSEKPSSPRKTWKPPAPQPPNEQAQSPQKQSSARFIKSKAPSPPNQDTSSPKKALFQPKNNESDSRSTSPKKWISQTSTSCPTKDVDNRKRVTFVSPVKEVKEVSVNGTEATPKQINWDQKVLDTLESQGFTRTQSSSRLVYNYNLQEDKTQNSDKQSHVSKVQFDVKNSPILEETELLLKKTESHSKLHLKPESNATPKKPDSPTKSQHVRSTAIANRAAMFEQKVNDSPVKPGKDPALLSLAERKALFEKNKGEALVPKAAFGMSAPVKVDTTMKASESKFIGASKSVPAARTVIESSTKSQNHNTEVNAQNALKIQENRWKDPASRVKSHAPPPPPPPASQAPPTTIKKSPPSPKKAPPTVAMVHQAQGIASKMAALLENKSTISEEQIANKVKEERQKEMDMLLNRFNKNKQVLNQDEIEEVQSDSESYSDTDSEQHVDERTAMLKGKPATIISQNQRKSAEKRKSIEAISNSTSPKVVSVLEDVKRIKVSPPKAGMLYPNLSDIEATTTDQETRTPTPNEENSYEDSKYYSDDQEEVNTSFGRSILEEVTKNITPTRRIVSPTSSSDNSNVMEELDEILEELDDDSSSIGPTPPKQGRHQSPKLSQYQRAQQSNSFHYKSFATPTSPNNHFQSPKKSAITPRQSTELPLVVDGDNVLTLTHTVSFYRKQQNEVQTPVKHIIRTPVIEESDCESDDELVQQKIKDLQNEVNKQQNIISQTSQALNLCRSTPEFSGSTEQVEAERVLLVASHRRQAALHELQRLRVEGTIRPLSQKHSQNVPLEKGTLTISNIVLPLKQKYVTALAAAGGKGHHVVCLIKCGEQVVPTKLVSTVASNSKNPDVDLYIPGTITLNNIYSDFTVAFEVYCLQAQEECLPHEVKYHINKKPSKGLPTPKKNKQESRLIKPPKESPAGPQAVRTSSFALNGYVIFSVQAVNKRIWSLINTPQMSPLEGNVEMKIQCELAVTVEHKGFLTMFEDVSGFGAWHRRWCQLKGQSLSYWKYPDDMKKMPPIDTIDLKTCVTEQIKPVSREVCARLHTFLLERERPAYPTDKDTLVLVRKGEKTIIRHLLSADTKEERIEWCQKLNCALTALRMWGNSKN